ncbi:MAG TPA: hypothetical protein VHF22_16065, partial [Planctomycetota bacterium]|nr:hypothetical protein [Planctomycetota bacterium]
DAETHARRGEHEDAVRLYIDAIQFANRIGAETTLLAERLRFERFQSDLAKARANASLDRWEDAAGDLKRARANALTPEARGKAVGAELAGWRAEADEASAKGDAARASRIRAAIARVETR